MAIDQARQNEIGCHIATVVNSCQKRAEMGYLVLVLVLKYFFRVLVLVLVSQVLVLVLVLASTVLVPVLVLGCDVLEPIKFYASICKARIVVSDCKCKLLTRQLCRPTGLLL